MGLFFALGRMLFVSFTLAPILLEFKEQAYFVYGISISKVLTNEFGRTLEDNHINIICWILFILFVFGSIITFLGCNRFGGKICFVTYGIIAAIQYYPWHFSEKDEATQQLMIIQILRAVSCLGGYLLLATMPRAETDEVIKDKKD